MSGLPHSLLTADKRLWRDFAMVLSAGRKNVSMVRRAFRSGYAPDGLIPFVRLLQRFGFVAAHMTVTGTVPASACRRAD